MMFMPSTLMFTFVLLVSVLMVISSPSWLGAWVALEINLMSFIPMMLSRASMTSAESCISYFLVQAFSSLLMLVSILSEKFWYGLVWMDLSPLTLVLAIALMIKLGAAPFHSWFPAVSSGVGWHQNFVLMTVQSIGPMVLLNYIWGILPLTLLVIVSSAFVGSVGGLNQSSLRKLMAYSSINHLGWLLVGCYFGLKFLFIYFSIYMITNFLLVGVLWCSGCYYLSQVYYYINNGYSGLVMMVAWFSFGGLPPFIGFLGKWLLISLMTQSSMGLLCLFLITMSLVSLYYYTRVCYTIMSQSSGYSLVQPTYLFSFWLLNFNTIALVTSLLGAPMFVLYL